MIVRRKPPFWLIAALLLSTGPVQAQTGRVDNIKQAFARFRECWKPPPASQANPDVGITVIVSFNRDGNIMGKPTVSHQSERATDNDRLLYRIAAMEALQRCTPMPFTEGMAAAVAGHPFAIQFHGGRTPPKPEEKRTVWLIQKIL